MIFSQQHTLFKQMHDVFSPVPQHSTELRSCASELHIWIWMIFIEKEKYKMAESGENSPSLFIPESWPAMFDQVLLQCPTYSHFNGKVT